MPLICDVRRMLDRFGHELVGYHKDRVEASGLVPCNLLSLSYWSLK